jgi:ABC-type Fe3+-hydroxamate transport system substrate-binding protein
MPGFTDQTGKKIILASIPSKIVSVVPSLTELLYTLKLNKQVTGITKFCIHPQEWFLSKPKIGGTKTLDIGRIREIAPHLIIANKEENTKEQIDELSKDFPVWVSDINNPGDAYNAILQIGTMTGKPAESKHLVAEIKEQFTRLESISRKVTACYLIWRNPYMTVGRDTFIHSMLEIAGFENVFKKELRYPVVGLSDIAAKNPEVILLSSEPFPFAQKHIAGVKELIPSAEILLVDGEMFSWYGSRMLKAPGYFLNLWQHGIYRK